MSGGLTNADFEASNTLARAHEAVTQVDQRVGQSSRDVSRAGCLPTSPTFGQTRSLKCNRLLEGRCSKAPWPGRLGPNSSKPREHSSSPK